MWIIARLITGAPMVVNTNNVAAFVDNMNEATKVVYRDGSEQVIDMKWEDVVMKIQNDDGGLV